MAGEAPTRQPSGTETGESVVLAKLNPRNLALRHRIGVLGFLGLVALPLAMFPLQLRRITPVLFLMMLAMSWDVVSGYTGQLSFGHAAFFAIGGYTSAVVNAQHQLSPLLSIPIAVVVAGIAGVLIGVPALRLRGPYLSLVTLIVPIIMGKLFILFEGSLVLFTNSFLPDLPLAPNGLGGRGGIIQGVGTLVNQPGFDNAVFNVGATTILGEGFTATQMVVLTRYYISLATLVVILGVLLAVTRSSAGTVFTAIREDEDAVEAAGLNPAKFKLFAFVLSGMVGGLAAAVYIHATPTIPGPRQLLGLANIQLSINVIIMAILGGTGTIVGGAVGAAFFAVANIVITSLGLGNLTPLPLLTAALAVLFLLPGGLVRGSIRAGRYTLDYRRGQAAPPSEKVRETVADRGDLSDTAVGSIVENYREELEKVTDEDGGEDR